MSVYWIIVNGAGRPLTKRDHYDPDFPWVWTQHRTQGHLFGSAEAAEPVAQAMREVLAQLPPLGGQAYVPAANGLLVTAQQAGEIHILKVNEHREELNPCVYCGKDVACPGNTPKESPRHVCSGCYEVSSRLRDFLRHAPGRRLAYVLLEADAWTRQDVVALLAELRDEQGMDAQQAAIGMSRAAKGGLRLLDLMQLDHDLVTRFWADHRGWGYPPLPWEQEGNTYPETAPPAQGEAVAREEGEWER